MLRLYQRWGLFLHDDDFDAVLFEALHRFIRDVVVRDDDIDSIEHARQKPD